MNPAMTPRESCDDSPPPRRALDRGKGLRLQPDNRESERDASQVTIRPGRGQHREASGALGAREMTTRPAVNRIGFARNLSAAVLRSRLYLRRFLSLGDCRRLTTCRKSRTMPQEGGRTPVSRPAGWQPWGRRWARSGRVFGRDQVPVVADERLNPQGAAFADLLVGLQHQNDVAVGGEALRWMVLLVRLMLVRRNACGLIGYRACGRLAQLYQLAAKSEENQ
jgi:hypothetical protein